MRWNRTLRRIATAALMLLTPLMLHAQKTVVTGSVIDAKTLEPVQYAALYFAGTTIGTEADADGNFSLTTDNPNAWLLCCEMAGYRTAAQEVRPGRETVVRFRLQPVDQQLEEAFVKADDSKARALLDSISAHRAANNPGQRPSWECSVYNRMDLGVTAEQYTPLLVTESLLDRVHATGYDAETVEAMQSTGVSPDPRLVAQFTGSTQFRVDFYSSTIKWPGIDFPSPLAPSGLLHYDYYIVDTLQVGGRSTLVVHYRPKSSNVGPAFAGEMRIDEADFALRSIRARMKAGSGVNWLSNLSVSSEFDKVGDTAWFYASEKIRADVSAALYDTTATNFFTVNRDLTFSKPDFSSVTIDPGRYGNSVTVLPEATSRGESYWTANRPFPLSQRDLELRGMALKVERNQKVQNAYKALVTIATGYLDLGKIELGPYYRIASWNNLEGFRAQLGVRTTPDFSEKDRLGVYAAYGLGDHEWKGAAKWEHVFSREPVAKLTLSASHDVVQLGAGTMGASGIYGSALTRQGSQRLAEESLAAVKFEKELPYGFDLTADADARRLYPSDFVPMDSHLDAAELHIGARWCLHETSIHGVFTKTHIYSKWPAVSLDLTGGLWKSGTEGGYARPELSVDWSPSFGSLGRSSIHLDGGAILGDVPYTLLHLPEGNPTFISDRTAFACLDYFEYAADRWTTFRWNHCFEGLILGHLPLIKYLHLREEVAFRSVMGSCSTPLPDWISPLGSKPYCEAGFGISNILRLFRVDFTWRLTDRGEDTRNFAVGIGAELRF